MRADAEWFMRARWGVFTHYLAGPQTSVDDWNRQVDAFDVQALARQLESVGAPYYFITLGQNSGHYGSPNATYDDLVGIRPSKLSRRDLIADLYDALTPRGISLLVYLPSGAPSMDPVAMERLDWRWGFVKPWPSHGGEQTGERLAAFQERWEAIIREWSIRWGERVRGWWFDGCYFAEAMYRHPEPPNFQSLAAAAKAGNADSVVAFNPGVKVPVICHSEYEDYTAGEISEAFPVCKERWLEGAQYHILSYLGERWGGGMPRFPDRFVIGYTEHVNSHEGIVTWDVPITPEGQIPAPFIEQLMALNAGLLAGPQAADTWRWRSRLCS